MCSWINLEDLAKKEAVYIQNGVARQPFAHVCEKSVNMDIWPPFGARSVFSLLRQLKYEWKGDFRSSRPDILLIEATQYMNQINRFVLC